MIADHKSLVAIFKKDIASLSQRLQRIFLCIHQDSIGVLYKPGLHLFILDWLSGHNHKTKRDKEMLAMNITIDAIVMHRIPDCMTAE